MMPISRALQRGCGTGLAAYGAVSALCAVAPSIWVLLALRFAQGCACGIGFVVSRAIVRDVFSGDAAARIFALLVLVSGVAPVLAPALGGRFDPAAFRNAAG